jgi:hypothetical protein
MPANPRIIENALIAKIAARQLKSSSVAMVLGKTIYLYGVNKKTFLANARWVKHELCHIAQFKKYGLLPFIFLYLFECVKKGYYNNKYEVAARAAEDEA